MADPENYLQGVYRHPKGWEIRYRQRGKLISRYRKTEEAANDFAARKAIELQGPAAIPGTVPVDSTATDARDGWTAALEKYRDRLVSDPGDIQAQEALKFLSLGANAAAKLIDAEARRRRIDRLERLTKQEREERAASVPDAKRSQRGDAAN